MRACGFVPASAPLLALLRFLRCAAGCTFDFSAFRRPPFATLLSQPSLSALRLLASLGPLSPTLRPTLATTVLCSLQFTASYRLRWCCRLVWQLSDEALS